MNGNTVAESARKLGLANIITVLILIGGLSVSFIRFETQTRDTEELILYHISTIEDDLKNLESRIHPNELDMSRLSEQVRSMENRIISMDGKLDRLAERIN